MRIAVVSTKGGVGKSTCSVHLAAALAAQRGRPKVVLLDGDAGHSAARWAARGDGFDFEVRPAGAATTDAQHVVVDVAANESPDDLLRLAAQVDRVVVPTPPQALDLLDALDVLRLLAPAAADRTFVLLNRTPPWPQRDGTEARAMLEGRGVNVLRTEIPARKPYAIAPLEGRVVRDVRGDLCGTRGCDYSGS